MGVCEAGHVIHVLGAPLDHGAGRRGVGMGPSALRLAKLHQALTRVGCQIQDRGDIVIAIPETAEPENPQAKYLPLVTEACTQLATEVKQILSEGGFPLVVGGDHSIAIGTISGIASYLQDGKDTTEAPELGVLWFDAHGDLNTPDTSPSGNIHGMPVACLLGHGVPELTNIGYAGPKLKAKRIVQIGLRDLDEAEKAMLREHEIHAYTMADIDRRGMATVMREAIEIVASADMVHVDFDIDVLDPQIAPGTGTRKIGGLTYREAHLALEMVAEKTKIHSLELVEVNPILDERNRTAEIGVGLIASALGARIL